MKWYKTVDERGDSRWNIRNDGDSERKHKFYATIDKFYEDEGDEPYSYVARFWDDPGFDAERVFDSLKEAQAWLEQMIEVYK